MEQVCSICESDFSMESDNSEELPFSCETCEEKNASAEKQLFCNLCVSHHVRREHRVLDSKGYEVSICKQHKSMDELFCTDCNHSFCRLCIMLHKEHDFAPIHEKCAETRKEVFKYINQFDSLTKDVNFQQQVRKDCLEALDKANDFCNPDTVLDVLSKIISDMVRETAKNEDIQTLLTSLQEQFRQDSNKTTLTKATSAEFDQLVAESVELGENLRQVLQNSDAVLVDKFQGLLSEMENCLKKQRGQVECVSYMRPFFIKNFIFQGQLSSLISVFLTSMVWPRAFTKEPLQVQLKPGVSLRDNFKVVLHPFDVYSVIEMNDKDKITFVSTGKCGNGTAALPTHCLKCRHPLFGKSICIQASYVYCPENPVIDPYTSISFCDIAQPRREVSATDPKTVLRLVEIQFPLGVELTASLGDFVAMFEDGLYIFNSFDNSENNASFRLLFDNQNIEQFLLVYYSLNLERLNCLIYDEKLKEIRSVLEDKSFERYQCPEKPSAVTVSRDFKTLFVALKSTAEILVLSNGKTEIIPPVHHGLRTIDALQFVNDEVSNTPVLLAWNYTKRICVILRHYNSKYIPIGVVSPTVPDGGAEHLILTEVKVVNQHQKLDKFPDMLYLFYTDAKNETPSNFKITVKELLTDFLQLSKVLVFFQ